MTTLFLGGGAYEVHLSAGGQETLVRRYRAASLKRSGRDEGLAGQRVLFDGTDTYYLLTDHLGSVVAVADSQGDLVLEPDELKHISCTKNIKQRPKIIPFRPRNILC
jgi:hypothetical protein